MFTFKLPKIPARRRLAAALRRLGKMLRRRRIETAVMVAAIALIFGVVTHPAVVGAAANSRELPVYSVERDNKSVSLTFDAAWGNEDTQQLIDILAKYNVRATFFIVGDWAARFPESAKALADAGHEVMNHSNDHAHFNKLSADEITANITTANEKIAAATGVTPTLFRAPYGEYDDNVVRTVRAMGMEVIQWDVDSLDWKDLAAADITKRVTSKVKPGSIVLFHNAAKHTPQALPSILENLLQNGYSVVPVTELLLPGNTSIDHTGRQIRAS